MVCFFSLAENTMGSRNANWYNETSDGVGDKRPCLDEVGLSLRFPIYQLYD